MTDCNWRVAPAGGCLQFFKRKRNKDKKQNKPQRSKKRVTSQNREQISAFKGKKLILLTELEFRSVENIRNNFSMSDETFRFVLRQKPVKV